MNGFTTGFFSTMLPATRPSSIRQHILIQFLPDNTTKKHYLCMNFQHAVKINQKKNKLLKIK